MLRAASAFAAVLPLAFALSAGALQAQRGSLIATASDSAVLAELAPRPIGPAVMSGRIADVAVASIPGERPGRVIYAASAGGGVWKTVDGGVSWKSLWDDQPVGSTGDVTVAPSNPDIVWVGSGESNNLRSSSWGNGVYKSSNGGKTWTNMGLRTSQHIPRIIIHPTNPDIVYVAAMGPLWASGGERGLYKTTDGGRTWNRVLATSETTGVTDVIFDPTNPEVLYAATMQRERKAYSFVGGGPDSGIFKSMDGGATWTRLTKGLPEGDRGRIGLDVSQSSPRIVYAFVNAQDGGVFRSEDGGENWTRQSNISSLPWYTGQVRVDPKDPNRVYHIGQSMSVSNDAGRTWGRFAANTHADYHAMWIDPGDPDHIVIGNDGGLFMTWDRGGSWDFAVNLPVSTYYAIAVDMNDPYWIFGGIQDNGSWAGPSATRLRAGISNDQWFRTGGGDGFYSGVDPTDPNVIYAESQEGALTRMDRLTGESKSIRPQTAPGEPAYRFNWSAPLLVSPHDHNTLYFGANYLFRSTDRGDSWTKLGGDLTRQLDQDTLPIMGLHGPGGYERNNGVARFGNIATLDESTVRKGLLYVGTDDGVIQVSRNGGVTWKKTERFPGVPDLTYVSRVSASHSAEGTVYAAFDGHRNNDFKPYVYKSTDYGQTWTSITSNLPDFGSVQVIREHPRNPNLLFVGTEFGLFVSVNGGGAWARVRSGFPTVAVHDLLIHPRANDLIVATHGRGLWVINDIAPLERLANAARASVAQLFPVRAATEMNLAGGGGTPGDRQFDMPNPPNGAIITYLANKPLTGAKLVITDRAGGVVRELSAKGEPGVHRIIWDLHWASPVEEPETPPNADGGFFGGQQRGPFVNAGTYTVQVRTGATGDVAAQTTVEVKRDPAVRLTDAQWAELQDFRARAYHVQRDANALASRLDQARQTAVQNNAGTAEIDSVLMKVRGSVTTGRGGRGGRGGGGGGGFGRGGSAGPTVLSRANGVAGAIGSNHFPVTAEQKQEVIAAEQELARQKTAADAATRSGARRGRSG